MSYPVLKYLLGLESKGHSITCKAIPSALDALAVKLRDKDTVSPVGQRHVSEQLQATCQNVAAYGWSRLEAKDQARVQQLVVVFHDGTWSRLDKILYVHAGVMGPAQKQPNTVLGRLKTKASALAAASQRSILAGMSRVPGVSGSMGDHYFHPPTRLRDSIITQRELSRAAYGEAAKNALKDKNEFFGEAERFAENARAAL